MNANIRTKRSNYYFFINFCENRTTKIWRCNWTKSKMFPITNFCAREFLGMILGFTPREWSWSMSVTRTRTWTESSSSKALWGSANRSAKRQKWTPLTWVYLKQVKCINSRISHNLRKCKLAAVAVPLFPKGLFISRKARFDHLLLHYCWSKKLAQIRL